MNENSFEWFQQQAKQVRQEIDHWPDWMKSSLDIATATFPHGKVIEETNVQVEALNAADLKTQAFKR